MNSEQHTRAIVEVDVAAVRHNIRQLQSLITSKATIMAVIKADAYGHGLIEIAHQLDECGVEWFAVGDLEEAITLRNHEFQQSILILGYTDPSRTSELVRYQVTATVYSAEDALEMSRLASLIGETVHIHVKIDTGMGRYGLVPGADTVESIKRISRLPFVKLEGIYSHFASAGEEDPSFCVKQYDAYSELMDQLKESDMEFPLTHIANSAGVLLFHFAELDIVRLGIVIYGLLPSSHVQTRGLQLRPAMSLKSRVIFIKDVSSGTPIGYGRSFVTKRPTRVATVPIGFADGYPRVIKEGKVLIRGQYACIIGRVCMNHLMVDVTDIPDVKVHDEVVLFGEQGQATLTVDDVARTAGTINTDILCSVGKLVPRRYTRTKRSAFVLSD